MKVVNGKIVSAREEEFLGLYLDRGMDDCMNFYELQRHAGFFMLLASV